MQQIDLSDVSDLFLKPDDMDKIEIDELFKKAVGHFNDGDIRGAKTAYFMFKNVVKRDPEFTSGDNNFDCQFHYLGRFHEYFLYDVDTAIEYYDKCLNLCPEDYEALTNRGFCRLSKNQYDLAIKDFKKAQKINSENYDFDRIIQEVKSRLNGGRPIREYSRYFKSNYQCFTANDLK